METATQEETSDQYWQQIKKMKQRHRKIRQIRRQCSGKRRSDCHRYGSEGRGSVKKKKEDGKTGQTDSGDQEKQPVQESGGAAK